ncbi:hypothetical protein SteCoe_16353 [Stentor coeruleus]|uniref:Uncharacterized protein n=1 Tax=Stentor coeruleus TaxID=5963 RepID=A0A1R2C1F3_9CILI|nr:hypothetical protein SteCoe_16353 [Stentor coeruleus]
MNNLIAKWKNSMEAEKERHRNSSKGDSGYQRGVQNNEKTEKINSDMDFIKIQTQKIIDILSLDQEPPPLSTFQQVYEIMQKVLEKGQKSRTKAVKEENSKNHAELEEKVNEIEREKVKNNKIYIRRENQELKKQVQELQERLSQNNLSGELVNMLKESQERLMNTNSALLEDIKLLKQAQADKDKLWDMELNDIQKALAIMKSNQK